MPAEAPVLPQQGAQPDFSKYDAILAGSSPPAPTPVATPDFSKYDAILAQGAQSDMPSTEASATSPVQQPDFSKYDAIIHPDTAATTMALGETPDIPSAGQMDVQGSIAGGKQLADLYNQAGDIPILNVTPEAVKAAARTVAPNISTETNALAQQVPEITNAQEGVAQSVAQNLTGLTTGKNAIMIGAMATLPEIKIVQTAVGLGFGYQAAKGLAQEVKAAAESYGSSGPEFYQHVGNAIFNAAMLTGSAIHAAHSALRKARPPIQGEPNAVQINGASSEIPRTAQAGQNIPQSGGGIRSGEQGIAPAGASPPTGTTEIAPATASEAVGPKEILVYRGGEPGDMPWFTEDPQEAAKYGPVKAYYITVNNPAHVEGGFTPSRLREQGYDAAYFENPMSKEGKYGDQKPQWVPLDKSQIRPAEEPTGVTEALAELNRRNGRAAELPTPENNGLGVQPKAGTTAEIPISDIIPDEEAPPPETPPPTTETAAPLPEPIKPVKGTGRFRRSYQYGQDVGDGMNALAAAGESGALRGQLAFSSVTQGLTKGQIADLGHYLVSERLKTVNEFHPQILSEAETEQILNDPKIQQALKRYRETVKPDIEDLRKRAGLTEEQAAGKSEEFISLIPESDEMLPPEKQSGPSNTPIQVQSKTTKFAKQAMGNADKYSTDLKNILQTSYSEVLKKTRLRDFYELIESKGLTSKDPADGFSVPDLKGKVVDHPAEAVVLGRAAAGAEGSGLPGVAWMPKDLAVDLRDVLETPPTSSSPLGKAIGAFQRTTTGLALTANPAEVINHMRRQFQVVAGKPPGGVNPAIRVAEAALPYIGPKVGAFARTVSTDMSLPENRAILQEIFDAGGGSTRAFSKYQSKIPGIKQLQTFTKDLMFSIPEGKGIKGWDLRMRVQMEKMRRAIEGNTTPQRIRDFANQLGQYGNKPDWHIEGLSKVNPYAATTLPLRVSEIRQLAGGSGLKGKSLAGKMLLRTETFLRGTGGTLLGLMTANYLLSGHYPWENEAGHEFELDTGMTDTDGKRIFVKMRAMAPELARPLNTFSVSQLAKESTAQNPDYISAGLVGPANQVMETTVGSPLVNTAMAATTGLAPYLTKQPGKAPELLDVAKSTEHTRGAQQLIEAARQLNPALNAVSSIGDIAGTADEEGKYKVQLEPFKSIETYGPLGSIFSKGAKPSSSSSRGGTSRPVRRVHTRKPMRNQH